MKVTLRELNNIAGSLDKLGAKELPVATMFKVLQMFKKCQVELETLDVSYKKVSKKYSEVVDGNPTIKEDKIEEYNKEVDALFATEVEVDLQTISVKDLGDIKVKASDIQGLEKILSD